MAVADAELQTLDGETTAAAHGVSRHAEAPIVLTILAHPDPERVGDRALLEEVRARGGARVSRLEPMFVSPRGARRQALDDAHLSRQPLRIALLDGGQVGVDPGETRMKVTMGGAPVDGAREIPRAALDEGVILTLSGRIALLLHEGAPATEPGDDLGLVGESARICALRREIRVLGEVDATVLIVGETGSGKELVARAIHRVGERRTRPFLAINMGAVPPSLASAELFGAVRGAYTGAVRDQPGHFRAAEDGTLFLDEVGETPLDVQAMLLRALDTGEVQALGSSEPRRVRARVITATDADLGERVKSGAFRAPLLHRLSGYTVVVPALRRRRDDIGRLFFHFLRLEVGQGDLPGVPVELLVALARYDWPGNVRQLRNIVRQLVVANRGRAQLELVPSVAELLASPGASAARAPLERGQAPPPARRRPQDITDAELIEALRACRFDLKSTAERLSVSRTSLYALVDACPLVRRATDIDVDELSRCHRECAGDVDRMAERLEVSKHALSRRLRDLRVG